MKLGYFYGRESEQFIFYRIPKLLITAPEFEKMSDSAKILYGLMLDRMSLSIKNGWFDEENRAYIIFTIDKVREDMHCNNGKAVKMMKELESFGLIVRIKHGQGKPAIIYVKKFISSEEDYENSSKAKSENQDFGKAKAQNCDNRNSRVPKSESPDFRKPEGNYNNINNNKNNDTESSNINPINQRAAITKDIGSSSSAKERWIDVYNKTITDLKEQIDYDYLVCNNNPSLVDEVLETMADVLTVYRPKYKIKGDLIDSESVIHKMKKIRSDNIEVLLLEFENKYNTIKNVKDYVISYLYNMPMSSNLKLTNMVNSNMAKGGNNEQQ